jgi:L-threonylcarbamoyladenylate synthase
MTITEQEAIAILLDGGVIGIPTDTIYGFACLQGYEDQIYNLKLRDLNKPLITMVDSTDYFSEVEPALRKMMNQVWPGSTTLIFDVNGVNTSYRIPNEENLLSLLAKLKLPIFSTSANISGEAPSLTREEFESSFPSVGLLSESIFTIKSGTPSTILLYNKGVFEKIR